MGKLTLDISMSLDGFIAGPDPTLEEPLGRGGEGLHEWVFGLASVVREDEDRVMEGRVLAPPGIGVRVLLPRARAAAEHPPAHHRGPEIADVLRDHVGVRVLLSA